MSAVEKTKSIEINPNSCESIARVENKSDSIELITEDEYKSNSSDNNMTLVSSKNQKNAENENLSNVTEICVDENSEQVEIVDHAEQTSCRPSTSSALMYSEYMNTSGPAAGRIFERKTKKPVILSYGESPMYKKYSDLLKTLQESKDEYPTGWGKKFPIIQIHLLLKRKADDDDSDSDTEDSRMVLYGSKKEEHDSSSSDEETSDDDCEKSVKTCAKIEVLSEGDNSQSPEQKNKGGVDSKVMQKVLCNVVEECVPPVSDSSAEMSLPEYDHAPKKLRLD